MQELILGSTSTYRAELLSRLGIAFTTADPDVDESERADELPAARAERLAREKARSVQTRKPAAVIIASDQVAALGKQVLRKPGNASGACVQLELMRGKTVRFTTALCVIDGRSCNTHQAMDVTQVSVRALSRGEISRYVAQEKPFDCAGSFRAEALGISLFERIESVDPTALIGLPLIPLSGILRGIGYSLP